MRKTSKELAEFYGIKVGDKVTVHYGRCSHDTFKVVMDDATNEIKLTSSTGGIYSPSFIGHLEYEVFKPKKKYGNLKCSDFRTCRGDNCPLKGLSCQTCLCDDDENTLYGILEKTRLHYGFDTEHPIYKAFKAELDKEVE